MKLLRNGLTQTGWAVLWLIVGIIVAIAWSAAPLIAGNSALVTVSGGRVQTSHVNQFSSALQVDQFPRNSSGIVTDLAGSLGDLTHRFLKTFVASGGWQAGDVKMHHSYNGLLAACGEGWMLMDGRTVSSGNYDTEHGAGHFSTYVISTPLNGKYLPDMTGSRYPTGTYLTSETGAAPMATTGNPGNSININHTHAVLSHNHTIPNHVHRWYFQNASNSNDVSYACDGSTSDVTVGTVVKDGSHKGIGPTGFGAATIASFDTSLAYLDTCSSTLMTVTGNTTMTPGTDSKLDTSQDIRPTSVYLAFCMRIID